MEECSTLLGTLFNLEPDDMVDIKAKTQDKQEVIITRLGAFQKTQCRALRVTHISHHWSRKSIKQGSKNKILLQYVTLN